MIRAAARRSVGTRAAENARPLLAIAGLAALALGIEVTRTLVERLPGLALPALLLGGLALCALAIGWSPAQLGLGFDRLPGRVLGGCALGVVLLLPAAVRWQGGPQLGVPWSIAAIAVSIGEEVAFRGVLFRALEARFGGFWAIAGTTVLWTAAHVLGHPPAFLPPVAAAGLLLALWRWRFRDLVGPIIAHVAADLAL
ncbi:MAG: CPBP family intramembrane glutamic endopeptidase [Candidatus Dormibacteraceae bacterium]